LRVGQKAPILEKINIDFKISQAEQEIQVAIVQLCIKPDLSKNES